MNLFKSFAKRHPLALFFALAFGIAWLTKPFALTDGDLTKISPITTVLLLLITLAPALATPIVLALGRDADENRAVRQRLRAWRAKPYWYLIALGVNSATLLAALGITTTLGVRHPFTPAAFALIPVVLLGAFGEELGWRGLVLPQLLARFDAVRASLVLGAIAALWHLPLYLLEPPLPQSLALFLCLAATLPAQAIIMTWIYQHTRGSLLLMVLFHASGNLLMQAFSGAAMNITLRGVGALLLWAVAGGLVMVLGPQLTRRPSAQVQDARTEALQS
jgi:membrane protease YdiL (CAAX protease family)